MDDLDLKMAGFTKEINMPELLLTITIGFSECTKDNTSEAEVRLAKSALYSVKQDQQKKLYFVTHGRHPIHRDH